MKAEAGQGGGKGGFLGEQVAAAVCEGGGGGRGGAGEAALDGLEQAFHGERFADVIDDAEVFGVGLVPAALVGGNHDDGRGIGLAAEVFQDGIAAHARHHHVENDEVGALVVDLLFA